MTAKFSRALVALSNFKGTLTNEEATKTVADALRSLGIEATEFPFGDGGAGTSIPIQRVLGGDWETFPAEAPLGQPVHAKVLCLPDNSEPDTIIIESSQVCGYSQVPSSPRDPMAASSAGLGKLLEDLIERWGSSLKEIVIALGDSAISDAGTGMLDAIGFQFLDALETRIVPRADNLEKISAIIPTATSLLEGIVVTVLCDVDNPLCGVRGSARVFSPQKGATPEQVEMIERGLENIARLYENCFGRAVDKIARTGSAGGLSAGLHAAFEANLVSGANYLCDRLGVDGLIEHHDVVVVGEGRTDAQTLSGKGPYELFVRCILAEKPMVILSGALGEGLEQILEQDNIVACKATGLEPTPQEALRLATISVFK